MRGSGHFQSEAVSPPGSDSPLDVEKLGLGPLGWGLVSLGFDLFFVPSVLAWATGYATLRRPERASPRARVQAWIGMLFACWFPAGVATCYAVGGHETRHRVIESSAGPKVEAYSHEMLPRRPRDTLVLPGPADPNTPRPLAVWLHGKGGSSTFIDTALMRRHARARGVAILGVASPSLWVDTTGPVPEKRWIWHEKPEDDEARIRDAIDSVSDRLAVDPGRVVLVGFAQGASVAAQLASQYPEHYAGAIALSPAPMFDAPMPNLSASALASQGYIIRVGAGEPPRHRHAAARLTHSLESTRARVLSAEVRGQDEARIPDRFEEQFGTWMHHVLHARGGLPERLTMAEVEREELTSIVQNLVRRQVWNDDENLLEHASFMTSELDTSPGQLRMLLQQARDEQRRNETSYPKLTDNDRLELALVELERKHTWVGRRVHVWVDYGGTIVYEAPEEGPSQLVHRAPQPGYVAYHDEAIDAALTENALWLQVGAFPPASPTDEALTAMIMDTLERAGLTPELDDSRPGELRLKGFRWQLRSFTQPDPSAVRGLERQLRPDRARENR